MSNYKSNGMKRITYAEVRYNFFLFFFFNWRFKVVSICTRVWLQFYWSTDWLVIYGLTEGRQTASVSTRSEAQKIPRLSRNIFATGIFYERDTMPGSSRDEVTSLNWRNYRKRSSWMRNATRTSWKNRWKKRRNRGGTSMYPRSRVKEPRKCSSLRGEHLCESMEHSKCCWKIPGARERLFCSC